MQKRAIAVHDISCVGRCSLTVALPVLSAAGVETSIVPTALLSTHTGEFTGYTHLDLSDQLMPIAQHLSTLDLHYDAFYSGYLANPSQIAQVKYFLDRFQKEDTLYLEDPVMGDHGQKYPFFTEELLHGMRELTSRATVITPNLTEACLLAGVSYDDLYAHRYEDDYLLRIQDVAFGLLEKNRTSLTIIVTGILQEDADGAFVTNLAVSNEECACTSTPYTGISFSGTGDLFASAICGYLVKGVPLQEAMDKAVDFLQPAIEEATNTGIPRDFGIPFQKYLSRL